MSPSKRHFTFDAKPLTRRERANNIRKRNVFTRYGARARAVLDALDKHFVSYNRKRLHKGRGMNGRTPWQAFHDGLLGVAKTTEMAKQEERKSA